MAGDLLSNGYVRLLVQAAAYVVFMYLIRRGLRERTASPERIVVAFSVLCLAGLLTADWGRLLTWTPALLAEGVALGGIWAVLTNARNLDRLIRQTPRKLSLPPGGGVGLFGFFIPLSEELFYRGALQERLGEFLNPYVAVVVATLFFSLYHAQVSARPLPVGRRRVLLPVISVDPLTVVFSLMMGFTLLFQRSLWIVCLAHILTNVAALVISASLTVSLRAHFGGMEREG